MLAPSVRANRAGSSEHSRACLHDRLTMAPWPTTPMLFVTGVRCHRRPALFHRDEAGRRHRGKARAARARAGELKWRSAARCYDCCWGLCRAHALAPPRRYPYRSCGLLCALVRCAGLRQIHPSADHAQAKADKLLSGVRECAASHATGAASCCWLSGARAHPLVVWSLSLAMRLTPAEALHVHVSLVRLCRDGLQRSAHGAADRSLDAHKSRGDRGGGDPPRLLPGLRRPPLVPAARALARGGLRAVPDRGRVQGAHIRRRRRDRALR